MGTATFRRQPASSGVRRFLERLFRKLGHQPRHLVSDQGRQFIAKVFRRWCRRRGIRQRFGAVGRYGSLAVIERGIRTLKDECTRRLVVVPYRLAGFQEALGLYVSWYNGHRPHMRLRAATPDEIYYHRRPAIQEPRLEPRPRWPHRSPSASSRTLIRGQLGVRIDLTVRSHGGHRHYPVVTLRRAA